MFSRGIGRSRPTSSAAAARVKLVQPNTLKKTDTKIIDKRRI